MSQFDIFYLIMIVGTLTVFALVLAYYTHR